MITVLANETKSIFLKLYLYCGFLLNVLTMLLSMKNQQETNGIVSNPIFLVPIAVFIIDDLFASHLDDLHFYQEVEKPEDSRLLGYFLVRLFLPTMVLNAITWEHIISANESGLYWMFAGVVFRIIALVWYSRQDLEEKNWIDVEAKEKPWKQSITKYR